MASAKRIRYESSHTTSNDSESDIEYKDVEFKEQGLKRRRARQPKSFSRNALLARENRLRKKMYIQNMERELAKERAKNKKISSMLKEQSEVIQKQEKDIKYMRSVLANSTDISRLLKSIHTNTGMSVGTSINKNLKLNNNIESDLTHPWTEINSSPTLSPYLLSEDDFDLASFDTLPLMEDDVTSHSPTYLQEHNYTLTEPEEDVGVCLHISKHKVALEFCSSCNENANEAWKDS